MTENRNNDTSKAPNVKKEKITKKINRFFEERRESAYRQDEVFSSSIAPDSSDSPVGEGKRVIYRNGIDTRFLVYVIALLCFGAVMSFSASYVYAEQKYDDSSYFIVRYVIFAIAAIAITVPFVIYARPAFWKCFGTVCYVGSVFLLLLVLLPIFSWSAGGAQRWIDLGFIP